MSSHKLSFLFATTFLCAFLSASAILLPTQTQSVAQSISVSGQKAQVSGGGMVNYPASISNPANFHPGYYKYLGQSKGDPQPYSAISDIVGNSDFVGFKVTYPWRILEPKEGQYNFSAVEADIALAKQYGKRFMIGISNSEFNDNLPPAIPSYMFQDQKYGCGPTYYGAYHGGSNPGGTWRACIWDTDYQAKYAALLQALGTRFNSEPYVEAVNPNGETAITTPDAKVTAGYSISGVENAFKSGLLAAKQAFPNKIIIQHVNFTVFNLSNFIEWLTQNGIGIGNPDIIFNSGTLAPVYASQSQYHDTSPTAPEIQWDNWLSNTVQTGDLNVSESMIKFAIANNNPWYLVIQNRGPYFKDEILAAVKKYPLPAAVKFYASQQTSTPPTTPSVCTTFSSTTSVPTGYAASYNLFSTAKELLLSAVCGTSSADITIGNNQPTTYIWNQGFVTKNGSTWQPITYTGTQTSGNWIIGQAKTTLPLTTTELSTQNYLAAYVCTYTASTWKCGCSDTSCTVPKWNLQGVKK